jgi:hypothetical protein
MAKPIKSKLTPKQYAESAAYLAVLTGAVLMYVAAEIILAVRPHPYHWGTALIGGVLIGVTVYSLVLWQLKQR